MIDEPNSIKNVVLEIDYDVSYLEDAPDEVLEAFVEDLGVIGERLLKLRDCLASQM